jgi:hypothetical protein
MELEMPTPINTVLGSLGKAPAPLAAQSGMGLVCSTFTGLYISFLLPEQPAKEKASRQDTANSFVGFIYPPKFYGTTIYIILK